MSLLKAIEDERNKLHAKLEELNKQKQDIDSQIAGINAELKAISAYESAKTGKKKSTGKRATGITTQIVDMVKKQPMSRAQIIDALGGKGNKTIEQSVSNALTNLKKKGKVSAKDGVYSGA